MSTDDRRAGRRERGKREGGREGDRERKEREGEREIERERARKREREEVERGYNVGPHYVLTGLTKSLEKHNSSPQQLLPDMILRVAKMSPPRPLDLSTCD